MQATCARVTACDTSTLQVELGSKTILPSRRKFAAQAPYLYDSVPSSRFEGTKALAGRHKGHYLTLRKGKPWMTANGALSGKRPVSGTLAWSS